MKRNITDKIIIGLALLLTVHRLAYHSTNIELFIEQGMSNTKAMILGWVITVFVVGINVASVFVTVRTMRLIRENKEEVEIIRRTTVGIIKDSVKYRINGELTVESITSTLQDVIEGGDIRDKKIISACIGFHNDPSYWRDGEITPEGTEMMEYMVKKIEEGQYD
jgi:hypothetical protein